MRHLARFGGAAALLAGCSPLGASPAASTHRTPVTRPGATPVATAEATHEYPSPAPRQTASSPAATPLGALRAFADRYINWSAATVNADMTALAETAVGQARSTLELAAAQTAQDYELQRAGVANHGTVETIAPEPGSPDTYIVVTRERTTATATAVYQGLEPAWHVALATVVNVGTGQWAVSAWQPQS